MASAPVSSRASPHAPGLPQQRRVRPQGPSVTNRVRAAVIARARWTAEEADVHLESAPVSALSAAAPQRCGVSSAAPRGTADRSASGARGAITRRRALLQFPQWLQQHLLSPMAYAKAAVAAAAAATVPKLQALRALVLAESWRPQLAASTRRRTSRYRKLWHCSDQNGAPTAREGP